MIGSAGTHHAAADYDDLGMWGEFVHRVEGTWNCLRTTPDIKFSVLMRWMRHLEKIDQRISIK
jgi:hypothetical protein